MKGLRCERLGKGRYYNVIFHIGSTYVPSATGIEALKSNSQLPAGAVHRMEFKESDPFTFPYESEAPYTGQLANSRRDPI